MDIDKFREENKDIYEIVELFRNLDEEELQYFWYRDLEKYQTKMIKYKSPDDLKIKYETEKPREELIINENKSIISNLEFQTPKLEYPFNKPISFTRNNLKRISPQKFSGIIQGIKGYLKNVNKRIEVKRWFKKVKQGEIKVNDYLSELTKENIRSLICKDQKILYLKEYGLEIDLIVGIITFISGLVGGFGCIAGSIIIVRNGLLIFCKLR